MHSVIIIPARYESSRFPGKPLIDLCGKTLIQRVWETCSLVSDSYVATDNEEICTHCESFDMPVIMTSDKHKTGTDRVFEASQTVSCDFILNVQGDEPLVTTKDIKKVMAAYSLDPNRVYCGMCPIDNENDFYSSSVVKVVTCPKDEMLYMSRAPIPSNKDKKFRWAFRQVCIYAFSVNALKDFGLSEKTNLEQEEDIEILRFAEMGYKIKMVQVGEGSVAVDYPEDADRVRSILKERL